jgi:hypothetical protein
MMSQPLQDHRPTESLSTRMGNVYLEHHVLSLVDSDQDAARTAEALVLAGFPRDAVSWKSGSQVVANHAAYREHLNPLQRLAAALPSDEGDLDRRYVEAASHGHSMVGVRVGGMGDAKRAADVLHQHHAYLVRYFRPYTIVDL